MRELPFDKLQKMKLLSPKEMKFAILDILKEDRAVDLDHYFLVELIDLIPIAFKTLNEKKKIIKVLERLDIEQADDMLQQQKSLLARM